MRESGFDISFRFKPYGAATHHYAPVCLNSLLFKTEQDLEKMSRLLGKPSEAAEWQRLWEARRQAMQKYLWDEEQGLFFDYNFDDAQRSTYRYASTFYPLWAGVATDAQAHAVVKDLSVFERAGGLVTSTQETEGQWDYPFGWAPIQLLAVEGMRPYGHNFDSAGKFQARPDDSREVQPGHPVFRDQCEGGIRRQRHRIRMDQCDFCGTPACASAGEDQSSGRSLSTSGRLPAMRLSASSAFSIRRVDESLFRNRPASLLQLRGNPAVLQPGNRSTSGLVQISV